jgi:hypothetical protein
MYGTIDDSYYEDPYLHDPRLLDLVSRVKCIPSQEADQHQKEFNLCDLEIVLKYQRCDSRASVSGGADAVFSFRSAYNLPALKLIYDRA